MTDAKNQAAVDMAQVAMQECFMLHLEIAQILGKLQKTPKDSITFANVGDVNRLRSMLQEVVESF